MDEEVKGKVQVALIVAGVVVMLYQFLFNWSDSFEFGRLFVALVLGMIAGAITFGVMTVLKK